MGRRYIDSEVSHLLNAPQRPDKFGSTAPERPLAQAIEQRLVTSTGNR
jgi:hypothetical protein